MKQLVLKVTLVTLKYILKMCLNCKSFKSYRHEVEHFVQRYSLQLIHKYILVYY